MHTTADEYSKGVQGLAPQNPSAGTVNGTGVDRTEFRELLVVLNVGIVNTGGTLDVKLQESVDDSVWTDIVGAVFAQVIASSAIFYGRVNLEDRAKFIRVVAVTAVNDVYHSVDLIPSFPLNGPQSDSANSSFSV